MNNPGNVITRSFRQGDEVGIVRLLEQVFGKWPGYDLDCTPLEHWQWKYGGSPSNLKAIAVCEKNGVIVGCTHGSPLFLKMGDQILPAAMGGDHAVHPDFRDQKLSSQLRKVVTKQRSEMGLTCVYFETLHPRLFKSFKSYCVLLPLKTRHLVRAESIYHHLRKRHHSHARAKATGYKLLQLLNRLHYWRQNHKANDLEPITVHQFDQRFDRLWEDISSQYRLMVQRDSRFLNRRYADSRAGQYRVRAIVEDDEVQSFIVLRIDRSDPDYPQGYVVDLIFRQQGEGAAHTLISEAVGFFRNASVNTMHCMVPQTHPARALLGSHGFIDTFERNAVFLNPIKRGLLPLQQIESLEPGQAWYSYGDIDSI